MKYSQVKFLKKIYIYIYVIKNTLDGIHWWLVSKEKISMYLKNNKRNYPKWNRPKERKKKKSL